MNREQRKNLTTKELREHAERLAAVNESHERDLAQQGFTFPPMIRFEVQIMTLADVALGEGTRRRIEFDIACQERWAEIFSPESIERMKRDAMDAQRRAALTQGVATANVRETHGPGDPHLILPGS